MAEGVAKQEVRSESETAPRREAQIRLNPRTSWQIAEICIDLVTVFMAAMGNYAFYLASGIGKGHYDPAIYLKLNLVFAAVAVFALHGYGVYRDELGLLRIEAVRKILRAVFAAVLLTLGISFLIKFPNVSRLTVLMLGPATILALIAQRLLVWKFRDRARVGTANGTNVLIYGAGETGRLLAQHLLDEHNLEMRAVGFLDDNAELHREMVKVSPGVNGERLPVLGGEGSISEAVRRAGAGAVIIAMPSAPSQRISYLISLLESRGIPFFFMPSAGDQLFSSLRLGRVAGMPMFTKRTPNATRLYALVKRAIDIFGSLGFLILTSPILAVSALLVRLTSPGPVFFTQTRIGLNGRPFTIVKLRTMHQEAPRYALHPQSSQDSRITKVGQWLRRLSIDELPQLYNVLKGEMSLVGPRPEMPFVVEEYNEIQRQRLAVTPGITGLWQISADRAFSIHDNIQYDLYYVERRSISLDLAILLYTPFALLAKKAAI